MFLLHVTKGERRVYRRLLKELKFELGFKELSDTNQEQKQ